MEAFWDGFEKTSVDKSVLLHGAGLGATGLGAYGLWGHTSKKQRNEAYLSGAAGGMVQEMRHKLQKESALKPVHYGYLGAALTGAAAGTQHRLKKLKQDAVGGYERQIGDRIARKARSDGYQASSVLSQQINSLHEMTPEQRAKSLRTKQYWKD